MTEGIAGLTTGLPGLLQPWGIYLFFLIGGLAVYLAHKWHRARPGRPELHRDALAILLLALLAGGFFWRVLTERNISMPAGGGDLVSLYFPTYTFAADQIKAGNLPLWNPHSFSGMPFQADIQAGLLYPLNWFLYLFVDVDYYPLLWFIIAHYWLASVFMYLFLRDLGVSRLGGLVGGVVFAYCGFMVAHMGHMPMVLVATWIPLLLLLARRAFVTEGPAGWVWSILAGLTAALSLLAGHVQIFAYGLLAFGVLGLFLLAGRKPLQWRTAWPWVAKGALIVGLALVIGAAQLLPSLELSENTARSSVSYEEASEFPAQPVTLLNLVLPRVYGTSPTTYAFGPWQNTENWAYCGIVTLALASAGLLLGRGRKPIFFGIIAALAVLIMVGDLSIVHAWMYKFMPGFGKLRDAGRALVLLGLGLAGLAAFGLDGLRTALEGRVGVRQKALWWLAAWSGILVVGAFGILPALYNAILGDVEGLYARLPYAINDLGMALFWIGLVISLGWAAWRRKLGTEAMAGAMLLVLVLDLFSPNSRFNPTPENVLAGYEHFDARSILYDASRDPVTGIPLRINSDTDVQNVWQPANALNMGNIYDTGGAFNPLRLERYEKLWEAAKLNPNSPLYDLTGAGFEVISPTNKHEGQAKWERISELSQFEIYQNKNALPRAYLVHEARIEPSAEAAVEVVRRFDVDPRHAVILATGTEVLSKLPGTAEIPAGANTGESVVSTSYGTDEVVLQVKATAPGWVVLTDNWYPGWEATVNGAPAPIELAYSTYRAVRVDTGEHMVTMRFSPASWRLGRVVSLGSLGGATIGLAVLLVLSMRKRVRPAVPGKE